MMVDGASNDAVRLPQPGGDFNPQVLGRLLLFTAIITFCVAAVASIGVILFGDLGGTEGKVLLSSFVIALYSLAGLIATSRFGRGPSWMAPLGFATAAAGLLVMLALIWSDTDSNDFLVRLAYSLLVLTGALAHANLLLPDSGRSDPAAPVLAATFVVNAVLTAMIVLPLLLNANPGGEAYWKLLGVVAVLLVLGTLVVPVVRKISGGAPRASAIDAPVPTWPGQGTVLELRYRGRAIRIMASAMPGEFPGVAAQAWVVDGPDHRPVLLDTGPDALADAPTVLGHAVQQITRAIDTGRI